MDVLRILRMHRTTTSHEAAHVAVVQQLDTSRVPCYRIANYITRRSIEHQSCFKAIAYVVVHDIPNIVHCGISAVFNVDAKLIAVPAINLTVLDHIGIVTVYLDGVIEPARRGGKRTVIYDNRQIGGAIKIPHIQRRVAKGTMAKTQALGGEQQGAVLKCRIDETRNTFGLGQIHH